MVSKGGLPTRVPWSRGSGKAHRSVSPLLAKPEACWDGSLSNAFAPGSSKSMRGFATRKTMAKSRPQMPPENDVVTVVVGGRIDIVVALSGQRGLVYAREWVAWTAMPPSCARRGAVSSGPRPDAGTYASQFGTSLHMQLKNFRRSQGQGPRHQRHPLTKRH